MLNCCSDVSIELLLTFNCGKSSWAAIGPGALLPITEMQIVADRVAWSVSLKYLGVIYSTDLNLTVNLSCLKRKFFCACNSVFGNTRVLDELLHLRLHESYSLPILQYATVAVRLNKSQVAELNTCRNAVYRRVFGFMKSEPIRVFIVGLGRLDFVHIRGYLTLTFFRKAQYCHNRCFTQMFTLFKCSKGV